MINVLFVCHGNICRSPMGEFILKDMVARQGIAEQFLIRSSAATTEEYGAPMYPAARAQLVKRGIPFGDKHAEMTVKADYDRYDYILAMDNSNVRKLHRIFGGDPEGKIHLLLEYAGGGEVDDPWYTDLFDEAYEQIVKGCQGFLKHLGY